MGCCTLEKNWQQCRVAGSMGVSQPLDLDRNIFVPATTIKNKAVNFKPTHDDIYTLLGFLKETLVWHYFK
jgi:hypothetical protein